MLCPKPLTQMIQFSHYPLVERDYKREDILQEYFELLMIWQQHFLMQGTHLIAIAY